VNASDDAGHAQGEADDDVGDRAESATATRAWIPGTLQGDPLVTAWSGCLARDKTVGHCRVANLPGGP
jgi:hypothetical protein